MSHCPCRTGKNYGECCGRFISKEAFPKTPEELMRSRYTAYVQGDMDYIVSTMQSPAADDFNLDETRAWAKSVQWEGLEVLGSSTKDTTGWVEFIAHYRVNQQVQTLHELSEFKLENDKWYYIDGRTPQKEKVGRNETCPCGSNQKYKKCCGQ